MARKETIFWILAALVLAGMAVADDNGKRPINSPDFDRVNARVLNHNLVEAAPVGLTKVDVDTTYIMGGPDRLDGKFEDSIGNPDWGEWTTVDFTAEDSEVWHVSGERVLDGSYSMVCGIDLEIPGGWDFGYGDNWDKTLVWTHQVDDASQTSNVHITGMLRSDSEDDWDFTFLEILRSDGWGLIHPDAIWDGFNARILVDFSTSVTGADYQGSGHDEIHLRWRFASDSNTSDQDQLYLSDGSCWLDNLLISVDDVVVEDENFEDGEAQNWNEIVLPGVGNFAQLYSNLQDLDPCRSNSSYQVAFIDNGIVVPGTGGTPCVSYCYGPGGYVVNVTGGLKSPEDHIQNGIVSEPFEWLEGTDAARLIFGVYMHEPMLASSGGTMYEWYVRSTTADDPHALNFEPWDNENSVWYGPPVYSNHPVDLTTYLKAGRQWWQLRLNVWEAGWIWEIEGTDATPHPYFDNVRIYAYPFGGPAMSYNDLFVAQDNFPEQGDLDFINLGTNSIRFDAARNISPNADLRNDPGDSIWVDVVPVRSGSALTEEPKMVVRMKANPVFDGVRMLPPGFSQTGNIIEGIVMGDSTFGNTSGVLVEDRYHFDLPDTGFFYPGDEIHYYFEAFDEVGGDLGHTMLPGDTTGFASFDFDLHYPSDFICRGLPTVFTDVSNEQPKILWWNDFAARGGENEWLFALKGCGFEYGVDYDIYYTNGPDSGEGNGLGGRATSAVLAGYDILLYTCGDLPAYALGNGDYNSDASRDIQVLDSWCLRGGKKMFMTGDNMITDISNKGASGQSFMNNYFGLQHIDSDVGRYIQNQTTPEVLAIEENGIFVNADRWVAYGGCLVINNFDAVQHVGNGTRMAEFTDENGNPGAFTYSAAIRSYNSTTDTEVVLLPYDLMFVYNAPGYTPPPGMAGLSVRSIMMRDILQHFGVQLGGPIGVEDQVPVARDFAVKAYPNPFNPQISIDLSMPRAGQATVKIFNVRGELVRTLLDSHVQSGTIDLVWDGCDKSGARSASGVYFAETKALGQTKVTRMAMIK